MLLQNVFCTRLMPANRPLKAAFAIFPPQGSRHHKYDTNVCKKGRTPMYTIDFTKPVHIHFIGIGGISMSGLAEILLKEGFTVSGSDSKESALTDHLHRFSTDSAHPILLTVSIWWFTLLRSIRITRNMPAQKKKIFR